MSVHDGKKMIGKYCGRRYPEFVESTDNTMIVSFESNSEVEKLGFKARYEAKSKAKIHYICSNFKKIIFKSLGTDIKLCCRI